MGRRLTTDQEFFTVGDISANMSRTPEGFLLCRNVPIARTGELLYGPGETPISVGKDQIARVSRSADELFSAESLASFNGKPVTIGHPDEFVNPKNWKQVTIGITQNVRRGEGAEDDLMLADLLITDAGGIEKVENRELRQVSNGYDADYHELEPGIGVQTNFQGNHVALVPTGRNGTRCSIRDEVKTMGWKTRMKKLFATRDENGFNEELEHVEAMMTDESGGANPPAEPMEQVMMALQRMEERLAKLEAPKAPPAAPPPGSSTADEDEEEETEDTLIDAETNEKISEEGVTQYTGDTFSRAEVLVPGISLPTVDHLSTKPRLKMMVGFRRRVLDQSYANHQSRQAIQPYVAAFGSDFERMNKATVDAIFIGASETMKQANNSPLSRIATKDRSTRNTVADINKANREFWSKK